MQGYKEQAKSFAAVSIFTVGQILLANTYLLDVSLYQPT
jgi:hypothetical protein